METSIPEKLLANWSSWWPEHAAAAAEGVQTRLAAAIHAWNLSGVQPLAGGEVGLVLAADAPSGEVVLKVTPAVAGQTDELAAEADALHLWGAVAAAPTVLGARDGGLTLLMARVRPGLTLHEVCSDPLSTVCVLGKLAARAHSIHSSEMDRFCHISRGALADDWRRELAGSREADEIEALMAPAHTDTLLHLDLHSLNVLQDGDHWVLIDPKPHRGDAHAEVFGFMYGAPPRSLPADPHRAREQARLLLGAYAAEAGLDFDRLAAWTRLRALATGLWAEREAPEWAPELLRLVAALDY